MTSQNNPSRWIASRIETFVAQSPQNRLGPDMDEPAFDTPMVGFSSGSDPLYEEYVAHIGDFYLTPVQIYTRAFPDSEPASSGALTVISWILPSTAKTRDEQAGQRTKPSERWARVRFHGEDFNVALRNYVVASLAEVGIQAVAPMLAEFWSRSDQGPYAPCSNWSERHAAHACGLGTFGLCDGLITPLGKAMRTGSVVARTRLKIPPRPYDNHRAYCLHYSHGTCGKCIGQCPVNALSKAGHDKQRCMQYTEKKIPKYLNDTYGIDIPACGLCQVNVPCMAGIPRPQDGL